MKKSDLKKVKKKPYIIHVSSLSAARRLFSRVLDEIQSNDFDEKQIKLLIYGLSQFTSLYRESEFESRIIALEKKSGNDN